MNLSVGAPQQARQLNPQLLFATLLVSVVAADLQQLLPTALRDGQITVSEQRLRLWQRALEGARTLAGTVPAILIFPPPPFVTFANAAIQQIDQALATIAAIPIASPAIFPPQPGQATLTPEMLLGLLANVDQARSLLLRALQAA